MILTHNSETSTLISRTIVVPYLAVFSHFCLMFSLNRYILKKNRNHYDLLFIGNDQLGYIFHRWVNSIGRSKNLKLYYMFSLYLDLKKSHQNWSRGS